MITDIDIPGYEINECLSGNGKTVVFRARQLVDGKPVIVKTLHTEYPSLKHLGRLRHEYEIIRSLKGESQVPFLELKQFNGRLALIMADHGGISLYQQMQLKPLKFQLCLDIFCQITSQLASLQEQGVIHKDINTSNIVCNLARESVQLIDFSISSRLSRANQRPTGTSFLEGTLAFISPEQTGRMNRSIDYRTDFYSLGITFYQMLTGKLPFSVTDPMELVHCHIARTPTSPREINPAIPEMVSQIVMKLMAKNAEDRYQSAYGILADVNRCKSEYAVQGKVSSFSIGEKDLMNSFRIPQKLYGRDKEIAMLTATIERVSGGANELMLISGHSGVGKSALIHEIHKPMANYRGYLISGKFDQYQRNTPYSSLIQATRQLIRQLQCESDQQLAYWKERILQEMGATIAVLTDVFPELIPILGNVHDPVELSAVETENRFQRAFRDFLALFVGDDHLLVIFFDDLQWADLATLKLMRILITDSEIRSLLLIGSYRDEEVDLSHPLMTMTQSLRSEDVPVSSLFLNLLSRDQVAQFVADTLHSEVANVATLVAVVYSKTSGNPFFVGEFLKTLHAEGVIHFDAVAGRWIWEMKGLQRLGMTGDAEVFMTSKILKLSPATRHVLILASCIGNHFGLNDLSRVNGKSAAVTAQEIREAVDEGLLLPLDDAYTLISNPLEAELLMTYEFLHDQVQQAAYSLIPDEDRAGIHLSIGRELLKGRLQEELGEEVFDVVNHLNLGMSLLKDSEERLDLVRLNLMAGRKARHAGAYEPAVDFLAKAFSLLGSQRWDIYPLTMRLCVELAECQYLCQRVPEAEKLFDEALDHAASDLEKSDIYQTRTVLYAHQGRYVEAIEVGLEGLNLFGIAVPYMDDQLQGEIAETLTSIRAKMNDSSMADILNLPRLQDPLISAIIKQLINLWSPASNVNLNLMKMLVLKIVDLSLTYGNVDSSSYGYVGYALVLGSGFGDYQGGEDFGQLGIELNNQYQNLELKSRVFLVHGALVKPWRTHLSESTPVLVEAYEAGLQSGDIMWACLCLVHMVTLRMLAGDQLQSIEEEAVACLTFLRKASYQQGVEIMELILRVVRLLRDDSGTLPSWNEKNYSETTFLTRNQRKLYLVAVNHYYCCKTFISYVFGDYAAAYVAADSAKKLTLFKFGWPSQSEQVMLTGLTHAALWHEASDAERSRHFDGLHDSLEQLEKWASECAENFRCRYLLLAAEAAWITQRFEKTLTYYDEAMEAARVSEFTHVEALAAERAGLFLIHKGKPRLARIYLKDAYYHYARWGATAKLHQLTQQHGELLEEEQHGSIVMADGSTTTQDHSGSLDLTTFMKASLTISSEIHLDLLLEKMMRIVIENAGAQKGFLLLEKDGALYLEAEGSVDDDQVSVLQSIPLDDCSTLCRAIINYVHHAQEVVVLANATKEGHFTTDPYLVAAHVKSLLCQPVMFKGRLAGVLYLENNLASGVFTPYRVEILKMLTSEAAISMENARLYSDLSAASERLHHTNEKLEQANRTLEQKVDERTNELKEKNQELGGTLLQVQEMQQQIIQQEKMASLGTLSAGIAHEIRNPLNFVNNFALISQELITELCDEMGSISSAKRKTENIQSLLVDLNKNMNKIHDHGKRADDIVHSMLMHSHRKATARRMPVAINETLEKFLNLAYHSMRAKSPMNVSIEKDLDPSLHMIEAIPQDLGRVFLNMVDNAFDSMRARLNEVGGSYEPLLSTVTRDAGSHVEVVIRDNGRGIEADVIGHIFNPFFTTKPAGEGTGLGLSISYDIVVKEHQGKITVHSEPGQFTEFLIRLPKVLYKPNLSHS